MSAADAIALLPLLVVAAASVAVLVVIAFGVDHRVAASLTLAGLAAGFGTLWAAASVAPRQVTPLLIVDGYALFYLGLTFAASFAVGLLAWDYVIATATPQEPFWALLLLATLGAAVLVVSSHFASFFLGLELLSVALYALIAYPAPEARPLEAGLKYLVLAGASSAFLLFGMALTYAAVGTMAFDRIGALIATVGDGERLYLLTGLAMILTGFGFKLALVPFHMWTPDVYEGAPAPVTAFVATVSKGAMFALLLRYFTRVNGWEWGGARNALTVVAIASILVGNVLALLQPNVKRLLAYSSIAHLGYLLVAFLAAGALARQAVSFYLVAYFVMTLGAFGIVTVLAQGRDEPEAVDSYRALFWHRPALAMAFTVMLLSLAGIPLTVGFVGKFLVIGAGVDAALWVPLFVLVAGSAIGLFYYLRVIVALYAPEGATVPALRAALPLPGAVALTGLTVLLIGLGVFPGPLVHLITTLVSSLG